jgi:hypothetical protein
MEAVRSPIAPRLMRRLAVAALVFLAALVIGIAIARGAEIVPALGIQHGRDGGDSKLYGSLALRGSLLPAVQTEIAVAYRNDSQPADQVQVRRWPVTGSLWLRPVPGLYAGGGVGWYHTTLDYAPAALIPDRTREQFGVHLGGGVQVPVAPAASLDLGGRYVMLRNQSDRLVPVHFNPDFWVTSVGLAIHF